MRSISAIGLIILGANGLRAQSPTPVVKGQRVAIRFPVPALQAAKSTWRGDVTVSGNDVLLNGATDWWHVGLPPSEPIKIADIKVDPKSGQLLVKLNGINQLNDIYLSISPADTALVYPALFAPASEVETLRKQALARMREWFFVGSPRVPEVTRDKLFALAEPRQPWDSVTELFQGRRYLRFLAAEPKYTYNGNMTSVAQRQAGSINEVAFPLFKQLGLLDPTGSDSTGYTVVVVVKSKDMAGQYAWLNSTTHDALLVYVPTVIAGQFARAEITNQDLLDRSVVTFNGTRIKIDLTK